MTKRSNQVNASEDETDFSQMAESAYGYNPIFQKRVTLGIDRTPGGGYHYYGPPPDVGTSYGSWFDPANKIGAIAPVTQDGVTLFSPISGAEMQYEGPANADMQDAVLSYSGDFHLMPASRSGHTCLTSADIYGDLHCPAMFNPFTGEEITEEHQAMKTQKKAPVAAATNKVATADGPAQTSFKPKTLTVPKVGQKEIPYSKDQNSLKPASHKGVDSSKDGLNKATNPHGSDEPEKEKTVKQSSIKPAGDIKVPDVGMDKLPHASNAAKIAALSDDQLVEKLEAYLAKADGEEGEMPKLSIELDGGEPDGDEGLPPPPPPAPVAPEGEMPPMAPVSEPPPAESDLGMGMEEPPAAGPHEELGPDGLPMHGEEEEPVIPVLEAPAAGGEMQMPMANMQLVKKLRATAAALRAGVKVEKSEQNALMAQAVKVLKGSKTEAPKDAQTASLMQSVKALTNMVSDLQKKIDTMGKPVAAVKPVAVKAEESAEDKEEEKVEEIMKEDKAEKAEGVHFEVLQSLDALENEGITAASVFCHLNAEGGANPFWNIAVHGEPLARIYLQDQERPDEIKALFTSPMYGEALSKASEQVEGGLRKLLKDANARFFTLQLDKVEVAQKAREVATAEAKKIVAERLATLSDRFLEAMATASIGMDRNFFSGGNPLKHAFAENLSKIGIPLQQAVEVIEASFSDSSADHFKALAKKATELMSMEPTAFDQLRGAILEAGTVRPVVDETATAAADAGVSMVQHLAEQSNAIAGVNMSVMGGSEKLSEKEQLRRDLGLSRR